MTETHCVSQHYNKHCQDDTQDGADYSSIMSSLAGRALVTACKEGDLARAASLVSAENVNIVVDSRTPLITAIHYQQQDLVEMILEQDEVNVNRAVAGWTALHEACFINNVVAIRAVCRSGRGVEMNLKDGDGYTPIMIAVWFDRVEAVKELLAIKEVELEIDEQEIEELAGYVWMHRIEMLFAFCFDSGNWPGWGG